MTSGLRPAVASKVARSWRRRPSARCWKKPDWWSARRAFAYIDHLWNQTDRTVKFWFLADYVSGERNVSANPAEGEFIVAAEWFPLDTLPAGHVFPEPLRERFRDDLTIGFPAPIRLPLRELLF
jgi:8-oxo-dGTP diphosphatase